METIMSLIAVVCGAILLLASLWVLKSCDKMEVSLDSVLGFALGIAAVMAFATGLTGAKISAGYAALLLAAATWAVRSVTRRFSHKADRRLGREPIHE
jgi:steroid 5-alpha reductase family enzyme